MSANGKSRPAPADVIANRRWTKHLHPFPHYTAQNVFSRSAYESFVAAFLELTRGRARYVAKHDTHGVTLAAGLDGPLAFFASRGWRTAIADLLGIDATPHLNIGLHHHEPGSADGFPHNDLNPGWFVDYDGDDGSVLAQPEVCSYTSGQILRAGATPRQYVRAAAFLLYLANPPWTEGDGGETGLYRYGSEDAQHPVAAVPPINNSMLLFECTPYSYHGFIGNRRTERNSLVMWWHRERREVVNRWGADVIIEYR